MRVLSAAAALVVVRSYVSGRMSWVTHQQMFARGEGDAVQAAADQPMGRLGRDDEIASAVLWLCSSGASLVIGVALPVDGGYAAR